MDRYEGKITMEFYHINRFLFDIGTIIRPGAWGRPILNGSTYSSVRPDVNYYILFREYVFEQKRLEFYPDKPSRLLGTFLCPNFLSAQNFWTVERAQGEIIYKVELLEDKPFHVADWMLTESPKTLESAYFSIPKAADAYWSYPQKQDYSESADNSLEVITESAIRISEIVYP